MIKVIVRINEFNFEIFLTNLAMNFLNIHLKHI